MKYNKYKYTGFRSGIECWRIPQDVLKDLNGDGLKEGGM